MATSITFEKSCQGLILNNNTIFKTIIATPFRQLHMTGHLKLLVSFISRQRHILLLFVKQFFFQIQDLFERYQDIGISTMDLQGPTTGILRHLNNIKINKPAPQMRGLKVFSKYLINDLPFVMHYSKKYVILDVFEVIGVLKNKMCILFCRYQKIDF